MAIRRGSAIPLGLWAMFAWGPWIGGCTGTDIADWGGPSDATPSASDGSEATPVEMLPGDEAGEATPADENSPPALGEAGPIDDAPLGDSACSDGSPGPCAAEPLVPQNKLILWLSADVGVTVDTNGTVSSWLDQSPQHNDATQDTARLRPALAAGWRADKPAVLFDGSTSFLSLPKGFDDFSLGFSLFVVAEVTGAPNCSSFIYMSNGGEMDDLSLHRDTPDLFQYEVLDSVVNSDSNALLRNQPVLLEVVHDRTRKVRLFLTGILAVQGQASLPAVVRRATNEIGTSGYAGCTVLKGHIAEMVMYARSIDDTERAAVEGYLEGKWQL